MSARLSQLEEQRIFEPLDVELARALARLGGETDEDVALAIALTTRNLRQGHVCSDLATLAGKALEDEQGTPSGVQCPDLAPWLQRLSRSTLVGEHSGTGRPLVLDPAGKLYLARYFDHEQRVAQHVLRWANTESVLPSPVDAQIDRLFPPQSGQPDRQREAALASRRRKLSIIVGGPGTGKTATVAKLLALLLEDAQALGQPTPRIVLVAPTGKAAQRLSESIGRARDRLPISEDTRRAIPATALTIHRALRTQGGSTTRFAHDAGNPLACDVLLLDEASMVDLALMRRLLDAVPADARVIMLGDPDQLASVEAGGVLFDLCKAASVPGSPLSGCVSELRQSYRYSSESGIALLANAVHAQDAEEALRLLRAGLPDVGFAQPPGQGAPGRLLQHAQRRYAGLKSATLEERLAALDRYRVLCSHRRGEAGVEQLNQQLTRAVRGPRRSGSEHYAGRPILVLQNDYTSALYNGDVGVVHQVPRGPLCAYFRSETGGVRELSLARLPQHESVYAMTVHKSQGSEFDEVSVVLPDVSSALLSRELLFTAITRARSSVSIYATEGTLRQAIARAAQRSSGLVSRLASPGNAVTW